MWFEALFPLQKTKNKMSSTFQSRQISFLIQGFLFAIVVFFIHSYMLYYFATKTIFFFPILHIYLFNFTTTALLYTIINYKYSKDKKPDVFNFFIANFLFLIFEVYSIAKFLQKNSEK